MPYLPTNAELIETPGFDISGQPMRPGTGQPAGLRYRTPQEMQSLLDMLDQQITGPGLGGIPAGATPFTGPGNSPLSDPSNWKLTRGDLESPLAYMANMGNSPFMPGTWRPSDKGGYFTLQQLFQGRDIPEIFSHGANLPSTNNWRLTVPYGGGPGSILRNGQLIQPGWNAARGQMLGSTGSGVTGSGEDVGSTWNIPVNPGAALSGNNVWASQYWPGGSIFGMPFGNKGGT
jgi:hypothetical protein